MNQKREQWGSRIGMILAVAGSAVGLGNFLRFPAKAAMNGSGAFLIPYFISLVFLGLPLLWLEFAIGRLGGRLGHGTTPRMLHELCKKPFIKYLGCIGVVGPFLIMVYYVYIESWSMGYAFYSMTGHLFSAATPEAMKGFLSGYQGLVVNQFFSTLWPAYIFFLLTFFVNFYFIYKGVSGGIEILSRYGMPLLIVIALFLVVRVFTMGAPVNPDWNIWNALGFVWNPDFGELRNPRVWLEAAGQIFFTLSVGMGCVQTYASYLREKDDIVLSGLSTASTNEFCEVILGGSIVIPAAFLFFGPVMAREVAHSGTFNIGFVTMPLVFHQVPFGTIFSVCWFLLLFIAGITSSVALIQPAMAFLEDEFQLTRKRATFVLGSIAFVLCHLPILFFGNGLVDELDFWAGTFLLVLFATIEFVLFAWVFGIKKGWHELHIGALIRIPKVYRFIITWITPVFLILLLGMWTWDAFGPIILMHDIPVANRLCAFGVRLLVMGVLAVTCVGVAVTWKRDKSRKKGGRV